MSKLLAAQGEAPPELQKLFAAALKNNASDLHLKVGSPPLFRIRGKIMKTSASPLSARQIEKLIGGLLGDGHWQQLDELGAVDFAYGVPEVGRFRINIFRQRGTLSMSARRVQTEVPTLEELNLPESLKKLTKFDRGLVLIGGITGAGKSTTLAALIQIINETRPVHIITIEDPIEYLFRDEKAFVNQREIGIDVPNCIDGLRYAVRQDPDVILIGEMRDHETFEAALMASETGHLVLGTIHTTSAPQTLARVLDFFPSDQHQQIRQLLYYNLRAIVVQKLVKGIPSRAARVPAVEVMVADAVIRKLIQTGEDQKLADVIRTSSEDGMQDINQSLQDLVNRNLITEKIAIANSPNPDQLQMSLKGIVLGSDQGGLVG